MRISAETHPPHNTPTAFLFTRALISQTLSGIY
jgi:hypothetical protein